VVRIFSFNMTFRSIDAATEIALGVFDRVFELRHGFEPVVTER
jgi:hypothetical protein